MSKTLIILNPHAANGLAGQIWSKIEPILWNSLGELVLAVTQNIGEVAMHLDKAYAAGLTRVISIGGDGTNHALVNALAALNAQHPQGPPMIYGMLPIGTGRDWARGMGMPLHDLERAAQWIANAQPRPADLGLLTYEGHREHFLNIASAGLGGDVAMRVNNAPRRRSWTFLRATVESILRYRMPFADIWLDDEPWYSGRMYLLAVANGTTFGHGMRIAPQAQTDDGLFDVVLVEDAPRLEVLRALNRVYKGTHLSHPAVKYRRAKKVRVRGMRVALGMELDGEYARAEDATFEVQPGLLRLLS